jgi:iron complex outermembrane receptor protein
MHLFGGETSKSTGDPKNPIVTEERSGMLNRLVAGVSYRHEENRDYQDYFVEPYTVFDLSHVPYMSFPRSLVFGGRVIPDKPSYSGVADGVESLNSRLNDVGLFIQDNLEVTKWLSLFGGLRLDYVAVESKQPELGPNLDGTGGILNATPYKDASAWNPSFFSSITVKPTSWLTTYVTYDRTTAYEGNQSFGGFPPNFTKKQLENVVELYEAGVKASLLNNTLFASLAGYYQTYDEYDIKNNRLQVRSKGLEMEATWQPNKNFNATGNLTLSSAQFVNLHSAIFTQTGDYLDSFSPAFVDSNGGRGKGGTSPVAFSPNYQGVTYSKTDADVTGIPNLIFNAYFTYQLDCGLGLSIGPQVTGEIYENPQKTLKIPAQVTWNAALFFKQKCWEVQLNLYNLTDERNFSPVDTFAANDLIFPNQPFHADLTIKLKF